MVLPATANQDQFIKTPPSANTDDQTITLPPVWLLVLCVSMGPLALTISVPANGEIMREFHAEYGFVQLMLTLYLAASIVPQLFMGYLSDRFGRRPVIMASLVIFIIGCVVAALAPSLEVLLLGRMIQGAGGSAGVSIARAIVRDVYSRDKSASVIAYINMAMVIGPMVGPALGGALAEHMTWRYIFLVLGLFTGFLLICVWFRLHETRRTGPGHRMVTGFFASAGPLIKSRAFVGYTMTITFAAALFFGFQAGAPFLVLEVMNRGATEYGMYFAITALGYLAGNFFSGRYSERVGPDRMLMYSLVPIFLGLVAFWFAYGMLHPLAIFLPMAFLTFSNGLAIPNGTAAALSVRPDLAGTAAGLSGAVQIGVATLVTMLVGFIQNGSFAPLLVVLTVCGALTFLGYLISRPSPH